MFLMQFVSPTSHGEPMLTQVFVPPVDAIDDIDHAIVRNLPLRLLSQTIHVSKPREVQRLEKEGATPAGDHTGYIIKWERREEPAFQSDSMWKRMQKTASLADLKFLEREQKRDDVIFSGVKLGGWGKTMQWEPFPGWITNIYDGQYLDAGTLHIFPDLHIEGDTG
jgi:hypothetical protein